MTIRKALFFRALSLAAVFFVVPLVHARNRWHPPVVRELPSEERDFAISHGIPLSDRQRIRKEMAREKEEAASRLATEIRNARETRRIKSDLRGRFGVAPGAVFAGWTFARIASAPTPNLPRAAILFCYADDSPEVSTNVVFELFSDAGPSGYRIWPQSGADASRFMASLRVVSAKMAEWQNVAQANGVTDLVKEFSGIEWPEMSYSFAGFRFMGRIKPVAKYMIRKVATENRVEYLCRLLLNFQDGHVGRPIVFIEMDKAGLDSVLSLLPKVVPALEIEKQRRDDAAAAEKNKAGLFL